MQPPEQADATPTLPATAEAFDVVYQCNSGQELAISFDARQSAQFEYDGQLQSLTSLVTARGAAYANEDYRLRLLEQDGKESAVLMRGDGVVERCDRERRTAVASPGLAPCRPEQIELALASEDAAMGHRQKTFRVTLQGEGACLLSSWPAVKVVPVAGAQAPSIVRTTDSYFGTPEDHNRKVLEQGRPLTFHLGWSVIPRGNATLQDCPAVGSVQLLAPAGGEGNAVPVQMQVCGDRIDVSPFKAQVEKGPINKR